MEKLIKETKSITLEALVFKLNTPNNLIVFFRSRNEPNGVPVFLKKDSDGRLYGFVSPVFGYKYCYVNPSLRDTILEASKDREIFVIDKEESSKLFKVQVAN